MNDEMHPLEAYFTGDRTVSNRELFYVCAGILLGELYESVPMPQYELAGSPLWGTIRSQDERYAGIISKTLEWLIDEALVRQIPPDHLDDRPSHVLTAKGLAAMQTRPDNPLVPGEDSVGGTLSELKSQARDASVSAAISQAVGAVFRVIGL